MSVFPLTVRTMPISVYILTAGLWKLEAKTDSHIMLIHVINPRPLLSPRRTAGNQNYRQSGQLRIFRVPELDYLSSEIVLVQLIYFISTYSTTTYFQVTVQSLLRSTIFPWKRTYKFPQKHAHGVMQKKQFCPFLISKNFFSLYIWKI